MRGMREDKDAPGSACAVCPPSELRWQRFVRICIAPICAIPIRSLRTKWSQSENVWRRGRSADNTKQTLAPLRKAGLVGRCDWGSRQRPLLPPSKNSRSAGPSGVCSLGGAALKLGPEIPQLTSVAGGPEKVQKKSPAGGRGLSGG
jgi:hypothetical protein